MKNLVSTFPQFVGFDDLFKRMDQVFDGVKGTVQKSWPPYNIVKTNDNTYKITMALAGFSKSDINVELDGNVLKISGDVKPDEGVEYLYKGISERSFSRNFTLSDSIEIKGAEMVNGVLSVVLENQLKASEAIKKIAIK